MPRRLFFVGTETFCPAKLSFHLRVDSMSEAVVAVVTLVEAMLALMVVEGAETREATEAAEAETGKEVQRTGDKTLIALGAEETKQ
jgi:hypothetical protein